MSRVRNSNSKSAFCNYELEAWILAAVVTRLHITCLQSMISLQKGKALTIACKVSTHIHITYVGLGEIGQFHIQFKTNSIPGGLHDFDARKQILSKFSRHEIALKKKKRKSVQSTRRGGERKKEREREKEKERERERERKKESERKREKERNFIKLNEISVNRD